MNEHPCTDFEKNKRLFENGEKSLCQILNGKLSAFSIKSRLLPLKDYNDCFKAVAEQYITETQQNYTSEHDEYYQRDFNDLKNVMRTFSDDEEIRQVLQILGPIEDRSFVALKLLIYNNKQKLSGKSRKRKTSEHDQVHNNLPKRPFQFEEKECFETNLKEFNEEFGDELSPGLFSDFQNELSSESQANIIKNCPTEVQENSQQINNIKRIPTELCALPESQVDINQVFENSAHNLGNSDLSDNKNVSEGDQNITNSPTKIILKKVKDGTSSFSYMVKLPDPYENSCLVLQNNDGNSSVLVADQTNIQKDSDQNKNGENEQILLNCVPSIRVRPANELLPINDHTPASQLLNRRPNNPNVPVRLLPISDSVKQINNFESLHRTVPRNHFNMADKPAMSDNNNLFAFPNSFNNAYFADNVLAFEQDMDDRTRHRSRIPVSNQPNLLNNHRIFPIDLGIRKRNNNIPATIVRPSESMDTEQLQNNNNSIKRAKVNENKDVAAITDPSVRSEKGLENINEEPSTSTAENNIPNPTPQIDEKLFYKVIEMFPNACPKYVRRLCDGKTWSELAFDDIVTELFSQPEYPQRDEKPPSPEPEINIEDQMSMLEEMLPECDPTYLRYWLDKFGDNQEKLQAVIDDAINKKIEYPSRKDYLKKQQISAQQNQYTTEFKVEKFIEIFPDPVQTFEDSSRKGHNLDVFDILYLKNSLRNLYRRLPVRTIDTCLRIHKDTGLYTMIKYLDHEQKMGRVIKSVRYIVPNNHVIQNIPLLQEIAYFEHKEEILKYIETKKKESEEARENARVLGLLQECQCCYDAEVMPNDILECPSGCKFCKDCIKKSSEVILGDGKVDFPCLLACGAEFSMLTLQNALPPKMFSILGQKKAAADIAAAGIEDLEKCPFCDFASIPAPDDKLFRCLNPDCMKESCRECKEPSHVPLRCDEVEKDEDVKTRTAIENKMTEALIRECWQCHKKFIKLEGCNKMTCSCGATMCYVCRQPVKNYKHFNGQGGNRTDLCPLYSDNFSVNEQNVLKAAQEAKKQIGQSSLKVDPTADLENHFSRSKKEHQKYLDNQALIQREHQRLLQAQQVLLLQQHIRRHHGHPHDPRRNRDDH